MNNLLCQINDIFSVVEVVARFTSTARKWFSLYNVQQNRAGGTSDRGCDVQRYTIEDKRNKALPEASFIIIEDYYDRLPDIAPRAHEYFKWVSVLSRVAILYNCCVKSDLSCVEAYESIDIWLLCSMLLA